MNACRAAGYRSRDYYERDAELHDVLDMLASGIFSRGDANLFRPLLDHLLEHDDFMLLADYRSYVDAQSRVDQTFCEPERWARMSILNVARAGKFSSDRAIREYAEQIWGVRPVPIESPSHERSAPVWAQVPVT